MIDSSANFSLIPSDDSVPPGTITNAAADALARILWEAAEEEIDAEPQDQPAPAPSKP